MAVMMPMLAAAGSAAAASAPYLALAGTAVSAMGAIQQGRQAKATAKFEAQQMEQQAKQRRAVGHQEVAARRREQALLESRALAAAGASGAGTLDPNVLRAISGIAAEGERAVQSELFSAETGAVTQEAQAAARRIEGEQAKTASTIRAVGTVLSGAADAGMFFGRPRSEVESDVGVLREQRRFGTGGFAGGTD